MLAMLPNDKNDLRPIPDAPGYFADAEGNIWSIKIGNKLRKLKPSLRDDEYFIIHLSIDSKIVTRYVHRLVCTTFHGPCPDGMETSHLDGNRQNNEQSNLLWETASQNQQRRRTHGTMIGCHGKLTVEDRSNIVELLQSGMTQQAVANIYGVTQSHVSLISTKHRNGYQGWKE